MGFGGWGWGAGNPHSRLAGPGTNQHRKVAQKGGRASSARGACEAGALPPAARRPAACTTRRESCAGVAVATGLVARPPAGYLPALTISSDADLPADMDEEEAAQAAGQAGSAAVAGGSAAAPPARSPAEVQAEAAGRLPAEPADGGGCRIGAWQGGGVGSTMDAARLLASTAASSTACRMPRAWTVHPGPVNCAMCASDRPAACLGASEGYPGPGPSIWHDARRLASCPCAPRSAAPARWEALAAALPRLRPRGRALRLLPQPERRGGGGAALHPCAALPRCALLAALLSCAPGSAPTRQAPALSCPAGGLLALPRPPATAGSS